MSQSPRAIVIRFLEFVRRIVKVFISGAVLAIQLVAKFLGQLGLACLDLVFGNIQNAIYQLKRFGPGVWRYLEENHSFRNAISRYFIQQASTRAPERPLLFATDRAFTNWEGLRNATYSGRQLPAVQDVSSMKLPQSHDVVELFLRDKSNDNAEPQTDCIRSSLLFAAFAQWFTDGFLRTAHGLEFDECGNVISNNNRPVRDPNRYQRNESNHDIDLAQIYGINEKATNILRIRGCGATHPDRGCLAFQATRDGEFPPFILDCDSGWSEGKLPIRIEFEELFPNKEPLLRFIFRSAQQNTNGYKTLFAVGLEHGNSTLGNSLFNTIFLREHNRVARIIAGCHSDWDGDRVFQTTRNVMIVLLIKIVVSDYIRHISPMSLPLQFVPGFADNKTWYRPNRVTIEFNLLYRWHALVPDKFSFIGGPESHVGSYIHNNSWLLDTGIRDAVDRFSKERAGRLTLGNTPRFLKDVKRDTVELMRASHLKSFNAYREHYKFKRYVTFEELTGEKELSKQLANLYTDDIDKLEWYVGIFAEKHGRDMIMGDLLMAMVAQDAFTQALTNPLLSKHIFGAHTFTEEGMEIINQTTVLADIVKRVSKGGDIGKCSFAV
ncbi:MAG: peroxidase family protein [Pseudomonadota bacterium]